MYSFENILKESEDLDKYISDKIKELLNELQEFKITERELSLIKIGYMRGFNNGIFYKKLNKGFL